MTWTDPKYANLVAAMKKAQAAADDQPRLPGASSRHNPVRGFVIPGTPTAT
ncbi:hypothetical protein QMK19_32970 [Streptomyces sp. H10-C2]|uniref:hypothetical protein n=1 Tax=unclassified Streptomyces TaxID=2593676 RepID=UPI0024BB6B0E|nr:MULTISPECIES: hypothetical protein [unclassified Streptomyces]MDJ0345417.1 hypothetical protein [Streptomyces sp. PH10-H1]MDJ0374319.1 hypothetical protein [Streptomyces sp. H10-C2]